MCGGGEFCPLIGCYTVRALPHNKVLRLLAERTQYRRRQRRSDKAGVFRAKSSSEQTCCCSRPENTCIFIFVHFQLNNAAVSFQSGEGLLSFTASLHSYVNGESLGCSKAVSRILGERLESSHLVYLLVQVRVHCWNIYCLAFYFKLLFNVIVAHLKEPGLSKMRAGGGKSALKQRLPLNYPLTEWSATFPRLQMLNLYLKFFCFNFNLTLAVVWLLLARISWFYPKFYPPESTY